MFLSSMTINKYRQVCVFYKPLPKRLFRLPIKSIRLFFFDRSDPKPSMKTRNVFLTARSRQPRCTDDKYHHDISHGSRLPSCSSYDDCWWCWGGVGEGFIPHVNRIYLDLYTRHVTIGDWSPRVRFPYYHNIVFVYCLRVARMFFSIFP